MRRSYLPFVALAASVLLAGPLAAQTPAERAAVDAFRDTLGAQSDPAVLLRFVEREKTNRPTTGDKEVQRLRLGWALMRYGQLTDSAPPMIEARLQFYEASVRRRAWPYAWFGLGATKLALDDIHAREIRSEDQPAGSGWRWGAANAFLTSVQADTNYITAAVQLGLTVMRTRNWTNIQPVVVAMSRAARSGRAGNEVWLVLGRLERMIDSNTAALRAFDTYLGLDGADQSMAQLERARTLFALRQDREGETAYLAGAANPSPDARALYRKDASWIADSTELATIDSASGAALPAVLGNFWRERETRSGRAAGSRIAEHYRRWNIAERLYRMPDALQRQWDFGQVYRSAQSEVDDRGVIFIRHGEPDDRATLMVDNVQPNESWVYHRPTGDLVLHFMQSISASGWRLIEGLTQLGAPPCVMPALLESRAPLDPNYQVLADLARQDSIKIQSAAKNGNQQAVEFLQACIPGNLTRGQAFAAVVGVGSTGVATSWFGTQRETQERLASHRSIVSSTTTDSDPLRYRAPLDPIFQVYGVGGRAPGAGQLLLVWALKGEDHPHADTIAGMTGVGYQVRIRVNVTDSLGHLVLGVDSIQRKRAAAPIPDGAILPGKMMLAVPAGTYRVMMSISDLNEDKGAARVVGGIPVPSFSGPIEMSDLVLGLEGQPVFWDRGGSRFPLNPRNAWTTAEAMEIGFELAGLPAGSPYKARLSIADIGADSTTPPKASVEFENQASGGREFVSQSLGLRTLRPGRYLLTATVQIGDQVLRREKRITVVQAR